jgi:hypothetical protein
MVESPTKQRELIQMETIIYQESIFGTKILSYVDLGGGNWSNADEVVTNKITTEQEFIQKYQEIDAPYN